MNYYSHHIGDFSTSIKAHQLPMVYVLATPDLKFLKIGMTTNPKNRFSNIQSGCPFKLDLWAGIRTPKPNQVEAWLHSEFAEYRTHGEWFALPNEELDRLGNLVGKTNAHIRETRHALLQA